MTTRPRILIVGQGPPTTGGIPTFVGSLVSDPMLTSTFELEWFNTTPKSPKDPARLSAANVRLALAQAWQVFVRSRRANLVHLNLAPVPALPATRAIVLALASKLGGSPTLLHAHTGRLPAAAERSALFRLLFRVLLSLVDGCIVVSRSAYDVASRFSARVHYVPNGVAPGPTKPPSAATDPPVVTFVGTVCERKGLIDLRDALIVRKTRGSAPLAVKIVGDSAQEGPGVLERVMARYAEAGLDAVEFLGAQDRGRVRGILNESAIFCLPSHWEGFPLSLLEAMSAGVPVVATGVGDVPEILAGGEVGILVPPHDPAALADAIDRLIDDPALRRRLSLEARRRVEREYGQDRVAARLAEIYAQLLPGRGRSGERGWIAPSNVRRDEGQ